MVTRIIVLVADRDDPKHGEITVLEDRHKAERLVETLLEAGFEQERIRVFAGTALDMQIAHRPMVTLVGKDLGDPDTDDAPQYTEAADASAEAGAEEEKAPETAYVRDGVRFSSLFRSS